MPVQKPLSHRFLEGINLSQVVSFTLTIFHLAEGSLGVCSFAEVIPSLKYPVEDTSHDTASILTRSHWVCVRTLCPLVAGRIHSPK